MIDKSIYNAMDNKSKRHNIAVANKKSQYYCIGCRSEVRPHQGKKNKWTFHHKANSNCSYSDESLVHKTCKSIFLRTKYVNTDCGVISACFVEEEVRFDLSNGKWFRPDIVFYDDEKSPILFIEIIKTNKPDREKLNKLKIYGVDTLAIHICMHNNDIANIESIIVDGLERKDWIIKNNEYGQRFSIKKTRQSEIRLLGGDVRQRFNLGYTVNCAIKEVKEFTFRIKRIVSSKRYIDVIEPYKKQYDKSVTLLSKNEEGFRKVEGRYREIIDREKGFRTSYKERQSEIKRMAFEGKSKHEQVSERRKREYRQLDIRNAKRDIERVKSEYKATIGKDEEEIVERLNNEIRRKEERIRELREKIKSRTSEHSTKNTRNSFLDYY